MRIWSSFIAFLLIILVFSSRCFGAAVYASPVPAAVKAKDSEPTAPRHRIVPRGVPTHSSLPDSPKPPMPPDRPKHGNVTRPPMKGWPERTTKAPMVPRPGSLASSKPPPRPHGPPAVVEIQIWPRSRWDPAQHVYEPSRIVVTRAIRICTVDPNDPSEQCVNERDAWSTVACREDPWMGFLDMAIKRHRAPLAHRRMLFHTFDNITYTEIPTEFGWDDYQDHEERRTDTEASSKPMPRHLEPMDWELMQWASRIAKQVPGKSPMVFRWDRGHFWQIPRQHWNMGERALATGREARTTTIHVDPSVLDDRPIYPQL